MFDKLFKPMTLLLLGSASTAFVVAPVTVSLEDGPAVLSLKPAFALAEKGRGGSDDDGEDDDSGDDSDDDSDDDNDSGDDDSGDDSGDDSDDDHGSDDNDDDSDDDNDDDSDDDNSGQGRGRGRGGNDTAGNGGGAGGGAGGGSEPVRIVKFETGDNSLEVTLSDGSKVEIQNGRYEYKDASGNTLVERRATQADVDKWMALR
jgi:hypothetical protein